MSRQKAIIEVAPPKYEELCETFRVGNFECPKCHGQRGFSDETGKDKYKTTTCDYCQGTGKVKATINVNWSPDYNN